MKVIIAEKPSVAREIAAFLGAKNRHDGYIEGNGFQVTWAFGHLVSLKEPEEYNPLFKKWSLSTLPIVPEVFQLKLIDRDGVSKQFKIIKKLITASTELIAATDAGREGELIFRYLLSLSGCEKKPFKRLWLSSLTEDAIKKAFDQLRPGNEYDRLYFAAKCRSEADWIVGLNATRNFTVRYGEGKTLWSVGRVQTPVLAMIAKRDEEIRNFISKPFWELKTLYRGVTFKYKGDRFSVEEEAKALLSQVGGSPFVIEKAEGKEEKALPPFLYDLTELQRDMNKKYGLSAQDTLQSAQELYEAKLISYPRTDSKFLGSDMKGEIPKILSSLKGIKNQEISSLNLSSLPFTSRIVNDQKTGEHHAIIPTGKLPGSLSKPLEQVYYSIVIRFIAAFYPACVKRVTTVQGVSNKVLFLAKGVQILSPGWTALYPKGETEGQKEEELPLFTPLETGPHEPFVKQGKTEPPRQFNEATLLSSMETAGKLVDDDQLKEALKQKGIGTPATRAAIIETLLKRGYIVREQKLLTITNSGRLLISFVQDPHLKSPELTGEWEFKLREIEEGKMVPENFMNEIVRYTKDLIHKNGPALNENELGPCPLCGKPVIEGKRGYGCSAWKEGCTFVLWKEYKGLTLNQRQARNLIQKKILLDPVNLTEGRSLLLLSENGALSDIPMPKPSSPSVKPAKKSRTKK